MKTEADLQKKCIEFAESHNCIAGKVDMAGRRGWPDLLILFPGGHIWLLELKHPNGKGVLSDQQKKRRDEIRLLQGDWSAIDSFEDFTDAFIQRLRPTTASGGHPPL